MIRDIKISPLEDIKDRLVFYVDAGKKATKEELITLIKKWKKNKNDKVQSKNS